MSAALAISVDLTAVASSPEPRHLHAPFKRRTRFFRLSPVRSIGYCHKLLLCCLKATNLTSSKGSYIVFDKHKRSELPD
ncbi:hypothetical protein BDZ89DRAFT_466041 [Hymenopellis radicata]|nr:hypothetical protein BDZ89DRAFT_466041 [Hymenopellis radicata]